MNCVVGIADDITECKECGRELDQIRAMVEAVEDGIYALDEDSRFITVNDVFCVLPGYDRDDFIGEQASLVIDEADVVVGEDLLEECADGVRDVATVNEEIITKDGQRLPVENRVTDSGLMRTDRGGLACFVTSPTVLNVNANSRSRTNASNRAQACLRTNSATPSLSAKSTANSC